MSVRYQQLYYVRRFASVRRMMEWLEDASASYSANPLFWRLLSCSTILPYFYAFRIREGICIRARLLCLL